MANTLFQWFKPVNQLWEYLTEDHVFKQNTEFKGGAAGGNNWHTKFLRTEKDKINN